VLIAKQFGQFDVFHIVYSSICIAKTHFFDYYYISSLVQITFGYQAD